MGLVPSWLQPIPAPEASKEGNEASRQGIGSSKQASPALLEPSGSQSEPPNLPILQQAQQALVLADESEEDVSGPLMAIPITAFAIGFGTGLHQAAKRSSLVFMAENAHRRPDTVQGWYFYNKTKVRGIFPFKKMSR